MAKDRQDVEMNFLDHLEEMRWGIMRALGGLVVGMILCLVFAKPILAILTYPTTQLDPPLDLQVLKVQGMFTVYLEIAFFGGLIVALPYILYEMWRFIRPALLPNETRYIFPLIFFSTLLFCTGVSFAYFIIFPFALDFFIGLAPTEISTIIAIDLYIGFAIRLMLLFGLIFEMPVISYFLGKIGLINVAFMRRYRRHSIVAIFIVAAILTPPDPVTQIFLGIPLILLYEISIYLVWTVQRKAERKAKELDSDLSPPLAKN